MIRAVLVSLALLVPCAALGAPDYGETYTAEELAALDRALHAANMTRADLGFRKDLTEGHECLPAVREMLADPLRIPAFTDELVAETMSSPAGGPPIYAVTRAALGLGAEVSAGEGLDEAGVLLETPEDLLDVLVRLVDPTSLSSAFPDDLTDADLRLLRWSLPSEMDWHDVHAEDLDEEAAKRLEEEREARGDEWLHETAARIDLGVLAREWVRLLGRLPACASGAFPTGAPLVRETPHGRVALGTPGDDRYEGEYAVLLDPGGDDRYESCRIGAATGGPDRRVALFADLGGDDVYDCGDVDLTLGAAVLGVAAFYDLGAGNDRYVGGHFSLGAAAGGVAVCYDDGGSDVYEGKTFTQGAAGFGIGILLDDAVQPAPEMTTDEGTKEPPVIAEFDNDRLSAWANAQAFARCRSVALCLNRRGNDVYEAGGVYLDAPLFADRYQSFSQGFAIGERGIDYAGGIALIADLDGNDRYLGDIYNQGVGYWFSAGLLWDGGGNDTYEMTQYGQGSGIHLAVGGLVDVSGNDAYIMHSGLGQGGSHDYAASVLMDRGGNDRYLGMTSCNGTGLTNAVGIQFERSGNDTYAGRRRGGMNWGRPARGFSSIGVLVDLGGEDDYLGIMEDDSMWRSSDIGVGLDRPAPKEPEAAAAAAARGSEPEVVIPEVCSYEGPLTDEVFEKLWAISVRWEVGDNRKIVPKARDRLAAFGPEILDRMDAKITRSESGLELRAYVNILGQLREAGAEADVIEFLRKNLCAATERRKRVALYLTGEMKVAALEAEVVPILTGDDASLARRAAGALRAIGSHAGDETLLGWLADPDDELRTQAALGTLLGLETDCFAAIRPLLDHPLLSVRTRLATLLAEHATAYGPEIRADLRARRVSPRAIRTLLDVVVRADLAPEAGDVWAVTGLLSDPDWGMRADAARVIRHFEGLEGADPALLAPALAALGGLLETETDPYVRFCAAPEQHD